MAGGLIFPAWGGVLIDGAHGINQKDIKSSGLRPIMML
jgi:hypothetical protein